jgi:hypothetical protein
MAISRSTGYFTVRAHDMLIDPQWTPYGKRQIALYMCEKGKSFLGAALLLREQGGYEYPVLHLICQGMEVLGKGYLLLENYDLYQPKLKTYGHNLNSLIMEIEIVSGLKILKPDVQNELERINSLYSKHLLRYASGLDVFIDPKSISSDRLLARIVALLRLWGKWGRP